MSDLTFPDDGLAELASAYVDGAATADERARAEADPQVMALVAQLRSVSATLAAPPVAPDALREQHLAAALAAFVTADEAAASAAATRPAPARPTWRQRWLLPVLGAGATALVVAGVGIAALGGDDAGLSVAGAPATVPNAAAETAPPDVLRTEASSKQAADATAGGQAPAADAVAASTAADGQTMVVAASESAPADAAAPLQTLEELIAYTQPLVQSALVDPGPLPCPSIGGSFFGQVLWQDVFGYLVVVPDPAGSRAVVLSEDTCVTLASAVLPG